MHKIAHFLWFDNQAEEAMNFYVWIFKNSKAGHTSRYGDAGPGPKGTVMSVSFELDGQPFMALSGGPLDSQGLNTDLVGGLQVPEIGLERVSLCGG